MSKKEGLVKVGKRKGLSASMTSVNAGTYFYRAGVYLPVAYHPTKVPRYGCRPWISVVVCLFVIFRSIFVLLCPDEIPHSQQQLLFYLGDISLIVELRTHFSLLLITFSMTVIGIQYIHYRASHISSKSLQVKLLDINPINLITGKLTPQQAGIHNSALVASYLKHAFHAIRLCNFLRVNLIVIVPIAYSIVLFYRYMQPQFQTNEGLFCTILHIFIYMIYSDYFYSFTLYHMLYFYLVCEYMKIRMKQIIYDLGTIRSGNRVRLRFCWYRRLTKIVTQLSNILYQTNLYNSSFWSSIVLAIFLCFVINVSVFFYVILFGSFHIVVRLLCIMVVSTEIVIFGTIQYSGSKVNLASKHIYRQLNSTYLGIDSLWQRSAKPKPKQQKSKNTTNNFHKEEVRRLKLKILNWIGVFANQNFGFTCGHFFAINYWNSIQISILMILMFLKLVQFRIDPRQLHLL